jgi:hypothetical protein
MARQVVVWEAQPAQAALISCPVFEVFFGGARGGGKTDGMLGDFLEHADAYGQHAIGLMIRRTRVELIETIERSKVIYTPLGWQYHEQKAMWVAPNGARLRFAYLERDADAINYQGHSYTRVYVEEIGNFPSPDPINKLMATLRSGAGVPVGFRATGNPGGAGQHWVKERYIAPAPMGGRIICDPLTGLQRVFIPSKVADNKFLGPEYVQQLKASGSPELVRAWLDGDWDVVQGSFFPEFSKDRHVLAPFAIPAHWPRFRSFDWGSASPFSVGWWAIAGDDHELAPSSLRQAGRVGEPSDANGRDQPRSSIVVVPRGAIVRYREWYGAILTASGKRIGLKLPAEAIASGIIAKSGDEKFIYSVLDTSTFSEDGGPSHAERMMRTGLTGLRRADKKRVGTLGAIGGWDQVRARLVGNSDGQPMMFFFDTCVDSIRTLPALQHDIDNPEDIAPECEDHAPDEIRYACMSRPYVPTPYVPKRPPKELAFEVIDGKLTANMSVMEIVQARMRRKRREE